MQSQPLNEGSFVCLKASRLILPAQRRPRWTTCRTEQERADIPSARLKSCVRHTYFAASPVAPLALTIFLKAELTEISRRAELRSCPLCGLF